MVAGARARRKADDVRPQRERLVQLHHDPGLEHRAALGQEALHADLRRGSDAAHYPGDERPVPGVGVDVVRVDGLLVAGHAGEPRGGGMTGGGRVPPGVDHADEHAGAVAAVPADLVQGRVPCWAVQQAPSRGSSSRRRSRRARGRASPCPCRRPARAGRAVGTLGPAGSATRVTPSIRLSAACSAVPAGRDPSRCPARGCARPGRCTRSPRDRCPWR